MYAMVATILTLYFQWGWLAGAWQTLAKTIGEAVRYRKGTKDLCICFGKQKASFIGFTDAGYIGYADYRKSTSGYVFTLTREAVSCISRLQKYVALSTTETEYVAATEACKEAL